MFYIRVENIEGHLVMERETGVGTNALLTGTKSPEILGRLGHHIVVKLHHYPSFELSSDANVKKTPRPPHSLSLSLSPSLSYCVYNIYIYIYM